MLRVLEQQKQRLGSKGKRESIEKMNKQTKIPSLEASLVASQGDSTINFRDRTAF